MPTAHFEIHVNDINRAQKFYGALFGWTFQQYGPMEYFLVNSHDIGMGKPVSGALLPRNAPSPEPHTSPRGAVVTFIVADVDASYAKALEMGGGEALPPTDYEGIGRVAQIEDGEGNIVGMITGQM